MRPHEFQIPQEEFADKKPLIFNRVFFVPENSDDKPFIFPGWDHESLFGNRNPVTVEYCSGNGTWIAHKAKENPQINWVAVELQMSRGKQIWSKAHNYSLPNLMVVIGEGAECTRRFFANDSISDIYINFPDPWPKRRHAKNRIVNSRFIAETARVLCLGDCLTLVTDDENYSNIMIETVLENPCFSASYPHPHYLSNPQNFGRSFFDTLWREKGKDIRLHKFQKIANS